MPEIISTLIAKREKDYDERRFFAAIEGIDLDQQQQKSSSSFEDIKARVFSNCQAQNSDDILSLQGINAQQAGFGIGSGLEYSDLKDNEPKNPFS